MDRSRTACNTPKAVTKAFVGTKLVSGLGSKNVCKTLKACALDMLSMFVSFTKLVKNSNPRLEWTQLRVCLSIMLLRFLIWVWMSVVSDDESVSIVWFAR